ncbi:MAG: hypothetical protein AAF228_08600 [Pseudomonadota bacterium]
MKNITLAKQIAAIVFMITVFGLIALQTGDSYAQKKEEISKKTVDFLTRFALKSMPRKVTDAAGKEITFTNEDIKKSILPDESAREVIRVAYRSGQAQNCGLPTEYQVANYQVLVKLAKDRTKWTPAQRVFMSKLHWATVTFITGAVEIKEPSKTEVAPKTKDEKIKDRLEANKKINKQAKKNLAKCSPERKEQVKKQIEDYVKTAQAQRKK